MSSILLAQDYLNQEAQRLRHTARALLYPSAEQVPAEPFSSARQHVLIERLKSEYGRDHTRDIALYTHDMHHWMAVLRSDLREDVQAALDIPHRAILARTTVDFMPHMQSDAFVAGFVQNDWDSP